VGQFIAFKNFISLLIYLNDFQRIFMNWVLIVFFILTVSCGNESLTNQQRERRPEEEISSSPVGECFDEVCYEVSNEVEEYKIVESVIDARVSVNDQTIIFEEYKNSDVFFEDLICEMNVAQGEEFKYQLISGKLRLETKEKLMLLNKSTDDNLSLNGTWVWKGLEESKKVVFTLTILDSQRVIIRKSCES